VTFDLILLLLLALSTYKGWRSGALSMFLAVAIFVAAGIIASAFGPEVGNMVHIGSTWLRPIVGFLLAFIVLLIIGSWLRRLVRPKHGLFRGLDGLVGAVLGFIRGAVILGLLLALFNLVHLPPESTVQQSRLYPILIKTSTSFIAVLKPYMHLPSEGGGVPI